MAALAGFLSLATAGDLRASTVTVALQPSLAPVSPGQIFDLEITIPTAQDSFNAYEAHITFDPSELTFIQMSPLSLQEGALMTDACSFRWHSFSESSGRIDLTHSLLCAGAAVAGPGVVYRLRFQAASAAAISHVRFESILFADAGIQVNSVQSSDATVLVGDVTGIPDSGTTLGLALGPPYPNPFQSSTRLAVTLDHEGPVSLVIYSLAGREVRTLHRGFLAARIETVFPWDGRDDRGMTVPAGIYFVRLAGADGTTTQRLVKRR